MSIVAVVEALAEQLCVGAPDQDEAPIFVADSGLHSAENVARLNRAGVRWISRVPDTSEQARVALALADATWQQAGPLWWTATPQAPDGERWVLVRTAQGEERARATLLRQVEQAHQI